MKLYDETDWMDLKPFIKRVANGRPINECIYEIRAEITKKIAVSSVFFIRNFLSTVSKENEIVRQEPWIGQTILDLCCESQLKRRIAQQVVEIKPRQVGWTQHNVGRAFKAAMMPNTTSLILVNDEDIAADFMERIGTFYNQLPAWMRPMKRLDNPKILQFDNPRAEQRAENPGLGSKIVCTVPSGIRGMKPSYFVWSETAFTKDQKAVEEGVFNAMGSSWHYCTILDSTPNGEDDFYFPIAMEAIERNPKWVAAWERKGAPTRQQIIDGILGEPDRPKAGWVPAFMPWHWHDQYGTKDELPQGMLEKLEEDEIKYVKQTLGKKEAYGGEEEIELVERYGVSLYRLAWRRWMIDNKTAGADRYERLLTFRQEFASDYRSCFRKFGKSTFDIKGMEVLGRQVMPPPIRGKIRWNEEKKSYYIDQKFHSDWESLRIWATPQRHEEYVIGVDGSNQYLSSDTDSWVAQVLRRRDRKQVAVYEMRCPPHIVRDNLRDLYYYYNRAYLGIEMEGAAISVAHELYKMGVDHQYVYKRFDADPYKDPGQYLGWETNVKTRPIMQSLLVEAIGNRVGEDAVPTITLRDDKTYRELIDCTRDEYGKIANHSSGGHDDHAIALMIALAINEDVWDRPKPKRAPKDDRPDNPLLAEYMGPRRTGRNMPTYDSL